MLEKDFCGRPGTRAVEPLKKKIVMEIIFWKNLTNRLYKEPQVTQVIRSNRLRWLGHIWRSPENNQTRAYTFNNPMGSRTRGRPPTRPSSRVVAYCGSTPQVRVLFSGWTDHLIGKSAHAPQRPMVTYNGMVDAFKHNNEKLSFGGCWPQVWRRGVLGGVKRGWKTGRSAPGDLHVPLHEKSARGRRNQGATDANFKSQTT
ncbi:endonuclease-reverse transcriptase [Trichonephila clavipes]|nr:endonuclease-reverse transcriptase [Trichonephila clavipes]